MNFNPAEVIYNGIQEGYRGEHYYIFTDKVTKSSFTVADDESLEDKLADVRARFREKKQ